MAWFRGIVEKGAIGRPLASWVPFAFVLGFATPLHAAEGSSTAESRGPAVSLRGTPTTQTESTQTESNTTLLDSLFRFPNFLSLSSVSSVFVKPAVERRPVGMKTVCGSSCVEHAGTPSKRRVVTGAVVAGVAAAGIGAGLVVLLTQASRDERASAVPELQVRLAGNKGAASVRWRF